MNSIEILPSSVPTSADELFTDAKVISTFVDRMHLDVTDGVFTPHFSWPYYERGMLGDVDISRTQGLFIEVHLMVKDPLDIGVRFIEAGVRRIAAHIESFEDEHAAKKAIRLWRTHGAEVGLSLKLETPIDAFQLYENDCDFIHLMSIASIGTQGIPYDARILDRVRAVRANFPIITIGVDGGISEQNIGELVRAGARRFSVGTAVMKSKDPPAAYGVVRIAAESALY